MLVHKREILHINKPDLVLPSRVVSVLQDFADVLPEELPEGLPHIRGIEHQIDFIQRASLPNRPA